jgi:hypothetical protein
VRQEFAAACEDDDAPVAPRLITIATFGLTCFDWPRVDVVARTALVVGRNVLKRWAAPNARRYHEVMPGVAAARWAHLGFETDTLLGHFQQTADLAAGGKIDDLIGLLTEPLVPRGWLARLPEPTQISLALDSLNQLLGPPASSVKRALTAVEEAVAKAAADTAAAFVLDLHNLLPVIVDDPQFRLVGTEELYRQFLALAERLLDRFTQVRVPDAVRPLPKGAAQAQRG